MIRSGTSSRGSIMIWTLLLGISLAVVFFFFSQRLSLGFASQQKTMEYLNARLLAESYADYLQQLPLASLAPLRDSTISFHGLTGSLTNATDEITGGLDMGEEASFEVSGGNAQIEWNLCSSSEEGVLEISPVSAQSDGFCGASPYDAISSNAGPIFTLKSIGSPLHYRIKPVANALIYDREWKLNLQYVVSFRKIITVSRTFIP